jgi:hypothetical protein
MGILREKGEEQKMNGRRCVLPGKSGFPALGMVFSGLVLLLFPSGVGAQTGPADYDGKALVAVLPFAGEERDMALQFNQGTVQAVVDLEKYTPREVPISVLNEAGVEIPTDMPPNRNLAEGVRYALTGGVYPGNKTGEYYLQLWLWDMTSSTMIYTDDLVYEDMSSALESLSPLVEWLFSHIRELIIETPELIKTRSEPRLTLGFRAGLSPRWYISPEELSPGAWALGVEGGISGALNFTSLVGLQAEILFTWDTLVYRGLDAGIGTNYIFANEKFTSCSLMIPLLLKLNFRAGPVRISPLAGAYAVVALGETRYQRSTEEEDQLYSYSFSLPVGFTAGFEAAVKYGPGSFLAGLRYAGDFGSVTIDDSPQTNYKRSMVSFTLGYEFGFLATKK